MVYSELSPSCGIPDVISLGKCFVPVVDSVTVDVDSLVVVTHVSGLVVVNEVTGGHEMISEFFFFICKETRRACYNDVFITSTEEAAVGGFINRITVTRGFIVTLQLTK